MRRPWIVGVLRPELRDVPCPFRQKKGLDDASEIESGAAPCHHQQRTPSEIELSQLWGAAQYIAASQFAMRWLLPSPIGLSSEGSAD